MRNPDIRSFESIKGEGLASFNIVETVDLLTQGDIPSSVREAASLLELG